MENLVIITPTLFDKGALIDAEIYQSERSFLKEKNQEPGRITRVKMLIDTGANISGLDRGLIDRLQLAHYSEKTFVDGAGGLTSLNRYRCVLYLDIFKQKALPLDILEGHFENSPYDGIIGRDVLRFCNMHYDGPSNCFRLSAPDF
ncbi:MAG TPA: retropepsin-like aspartic protease [Chitinophagaceae bacterium]|nr:retropepsin-like aspartic protease [Chitinophagaceae bacterium]